MSINFRWGKNQFCIQQKSLGKNLQKLILRLWWIATVANTPIIQKVSKRMQRCVWTTKVFVLLTTGFSLARSFCSYKAKYLLQLSLYFTELFSFLFLACKQHPILGLPCYLKSIAVWKKQQKTQTPGSSQSSHSNNVEVRLF